MLNIGSGEMWVRALTALPKDLNMVSSNHVKELTSASNSSSRRSNNVFRHLGTHPCGTHTYT